MSLRDEIANLIAGGPTASAEDRADAIIARYPYITADQPLYDYAASLRQQLLDTRAELEKEKGR